jgi:hypothetical protein
MNPILAEILHGAGLGDIVMPRKKFIKEHKNLIKLLNSSDDPALRKEAEDQSEELKSMTGGFFNLNAFRSMPRGTKAILATAVKPVVEGLVPALGQVAENIIPLLGKGTPNKEQQSLAGGLGKSSGFIRRLMAENALKHQGQYRNPTWELHPDSTMSAKAKFEYKKLANPDQRGINEVEYGASPFIQKHFGHARAVPFERKRGEAPPLEPYKSKRKSKKITQESEEQKKARRTFVEQQQAEAEAQPEQDVAEEVVEHSAHIRDDADQKEQEREQTVIDPRASSEAKALPLPEGIFPIDKTNELIKKFMIDDHMTFKLRHGKLTPKGERMLRKLYESIRFHIMNDENVRQLPDKMSHYGYMDLQDWARETHGKEMREDDNWLMYYMYGDWNGRWRMLSDKELKERGEKKLKDAMVERDKEFARQEEYHRKLAPSFHAKAKK